MRYVVDLLRCVFISPETSIVAVIGLVLLHRPEWLSLVGSSAREQVEFLGFLLSTPSALTVVCVKTGDAVLSHGHSLDRALYQWPQYWRLKLRVLLAMVMCGLASGASVFFWIFGHLWSDAAVGAAFVAAVLVALASTSSVFLAKLKVREILTEYEIHR